MNSVLERIHQVIANLIRTYDLQNNYLDEDNPWSGILSATDFAVRSMCRTTLKATPDQLVFGRDKILNTPLIMDWEAIKLGIWGRKSSWGPNSSSFVGIL